MWKNLGRSNRAFELIGHVYALRSLLRAPMQSENERDNTHGVLEMVVRPLERDT